MKEQVIFILCGNERERSIFLFIALARYILIRSSCCSGKFLRYVDKELIKDINDIWLRHRHTLQLLLKFSGWEDRPGLLPSSSFSACHKSWYKWIGCVWYSRLNLNTTGIGGRVRPFSHLESELVVQRPISRATVFCEYPASLRYRLNLFGIRLRSIL